MSKLVFLSSPTGSLGSAGVQPQDQHICAEGKADQCQRRWVSVWTSQSVPWSPDAKMMSGFFSLGAVKDAHGMTLSSACCEMGSLVRLDTDLLGGRHEMILLQKRIGWKRLSLIALGLGQEES